jgi:hypothetical protein
MALKSDGTVWCWGLNSNGQLGDGTKTDRNIPVQVSGLTGITAIAAGFNHSLALKSDGTVWAWGDNTYGQLSNAAAENSTIPIKVSGLTGIAAIGTGRAFNFAIQSPDAPSIEGASPYTGARNVPISASINWLAVPFVNYDFQLSKDLSFATFIADVSNISSTTYTPATALTPATTYYWRVRSRAITLTSTWVTGSFTTVGASTKPASGTTPTRGNTPTSATVTTPPSNNSLPLGTVIILIVVVAVIAAVLAVMITVFMVPRMRKKPGD